MKKGFYLVMIAQALSSVADNALLIAAIALIADLRGPDWMAPMMKWWFALAYVVLAAFVGAFADSFPKGRVMFITNAIKISGCLLMFSYQTLGSDHHAQLILVFCAYTLVGIGAAAYSPAKYGIVTEMLPPHLLVKGNSWIEGLTVLSIIVGTVLGGILIHPAVSDALRSHVWIAQFAQTRAEAAIFMIALVYLAAAGTNLLIPLTNVRYPKQQTNPIKLIKTFGGYVSILWHDKLGQISLAVTTLFWGAGATLQFIVIEWGAQHLGYRLDQASVLMGIAAVGTVFGSILAGRVPLKRALSVLPVGVVMGFAVMLMPIVQHTWEVYGVLMLVGALSGFFVVPMNALLQHRGHVLLSAGHSIAVQNFNEQLNILLMLAIYSLMLWLNLPINVIIVIFGLLVATLMLIFIRWNRINHRANPDLESTIGQHGHGQALKH
ncbi:lysophospholipid transporter LplT [Parapusillimonas granuli]|uniref:Lysophospholipid transporter LplT n=1 Tax=Parapusillimonas granuli TaxID=380911 RepID=A0A853G2Q9_9BURK|nr:lysophospholipid transporter LplT [Parapusillimonas granuli]MBB5216728.1 MFS family permease [Parapusillimonas granuli]MEB2400057.1 lysophospholipid transporter LplT [Alcaligenaceae bacterium]NYT51628.1 lysophospholipid transporter LplT [Parapusillimonas granuli]